MAALLPVAIFLALRSPYSLKEPERMVLTILSSASFLVMPNCFKKSPVNVFTVNEKRNTVVRTTGVKTRNVFICFNVTVHKESF